MSVISKILLFAFIIAGFAAVSVIASDRSDRTDCLSWQLDATVYQHYFISQWQKDQCDYWNIEINAPVI